MSYSLSLSISDLLGFLSIDPITPTTNGLKKKKGDGYTIQARDRYDFQKSVQRRDTNIQCMEMGIIE